MTGMKEGAGEDPFSSDDSTTEPTETNGDQISPSSQPAEGTTSPTSPSGRHGIPYKYRRDGVQDGRDRVPLFLQEETTRRERESLRELEDRFGESVSKTDLREALVLAGMDNLRDVQTQLEEWGYGLSFEE